MAEDVENHSDAIKEYKFGSTDFMVPIRADGMINATALCKAGGKKLNDYTRLKTTQEYLKALENNTGIPVLDLIISDIGGNHEGTWIHRKVGYHIAQWISPDFTLQMETILNNLEKSQKQIKPLVINDYALVFRKEDGYIDVTNLCKAGRKEFKHWNSLEKTKAFLRILSSEVAITTSKLIEIVSGGNFKNQGTWAHPQVAINIAQWISPEFDVKVSKWVFELMVTGKVELGNEKTNEELENLYKDQIKTLTIQLETTTTQLETTENQLETTTTHLQTIQQSHQKLLVKYNSSLQKHSYYKFRESGPCFYIFNSGYEYLDLVTRLKFGIAGTSDKYGRVDTIDNRLQSHRTNHPVLHLDFLIFTKDAKFIEDGIKRHYRREINPNGHEWIEGVCAQKIIDRVKNVLDEFCIDDYNIVSAETLKKYNDYVITTVKVDEEEDDDDEDEEEEEVEEEDDVVVEDEEEDEEEDDVVVEEKSEEEDEDEVVEEEKSEEEEDEDEVVEEEDDEEDEDEEQEIEEKIDIMKEQLDEYKEILLHLESYTVKKMDEILRKIGSSLTGTKDVKIKKIKDKLEPIIHKKPLTKKCDTCNLEKTANDKHFRSFKNKLLRGTCKACEFKKCAPAPLKIKPLVHTEITMGMETLKCHMCHEDKSVNDFYKNKSRGTRGYDYNCKNCETLRKCGTYDVREFKKKPADIPADCKWCPSCETVKNRSTFCPSSTRGDGLQYSCRACYTKNRTKKKTLNKLKNGN
jgi:hypothetical protein